MKSFEKLSKSVPLNLRNPPKHQWRINKKLGQCTVEYFVLFAIFATITMLSINFLGKFADPLKDLDSVAKRVISNREYIGGGETYTDRKYYESDWEARDYE